MLVSRVLLVLINTNQPSATKKIIIIIMWEGGRGAKICSIIVSQKQKVFEKGMKVVKGYRLPKKKIS